jgi:hypothetical protein
MLPADFAHRHRQDSPETAPGQGLAQQSWCESTSVSKPPRGVGSSRSQTTTQNRGGSRRWGCQGPLCTATAGVISAYIPPCSVSGAPHKDEKEGPADERTLGIGTGSVPTPYARPRASPSARGRVLSLSRLRGSGGPHPRRDPEPRGQPESGVAGAVLTNGLHCPTAAARRMGPLAP